MNVVFANCDMWVTPTVRILPGEPWDPDDPIVKAHPTVFDENPNHVRRTTVPPPSSGIEEATAEPGTRRTTTTKPRARG